MSALPVTNVVTRQKGEGETLFASPLKPIVSIGAQGRTRTDTRIGGPAPQAGVSTNSTTWASVFL